MKVFASVGTQKFPFNRLIDALDIVASSHDVFVQYGTSKKPRLCKGAAFVNKDEFAKRLAEADVAVVHGGVGTIRAALSLGIKVVAVPRTAAYGEHVDDHQAEIVSAFAKGGYLLPCLDTEELLEAIELAYCSLFGVFNPGPCSIEGAIEELMVSCGFEPFLPAERG